MPFAEDLQALEGKAGSKATYAQALSAAVLMVAALNGQRDEEDGEAKEWEEEEEEKRKRMAGWAAAPEPHGLPSSIPC